jgi:thiamine-monophosphate kinase
MARMTAPEPAPDATLAEVGEFELIDRLVARLAQGGDVLVGPGDDAALVSLPEARVLVATDVLVEDRHFRRAWSSAADVGHKAAAANLADIAAMGGRATSLTIGLAAPADLPATWALDMAEGIAEEAALVGASVVGGDVTRADQIMVSVTVLGVVEGEPVRRSGARAGDVVAIAGRQGWAAAGLAVLARGFRSPRALVEAHRRPEPPYDQGVVAKAAGATAMTDVSDGLVADAGHIARASGVALALDSSALEVAEPLHAVGSALGADPVEFVLAGGEDHALLATFPAGVALPERWVRIGEVTDGAGVTVDGDEYAGAGGYVHF